MGVLIRHVQKPRCCNECWFRSDPVPVSIRGVSPADQYKIELYCCKLSLNWGFGVDWHTKEYMEDNIEPWCPIVYIDDTEAQEILAAADKLEEDKNGGTK